MKEWYSVAELAAAKLPDLPLSEKSLDNHVRARGWRSDEARARKVTGKTKPFWEYHVSLLPELAQRRLRIIHDASANDDSNPAIVRKKAVWARYDGLSRDYKSVCEVRLQALDLAEELEAAGMTAAAAVAVVCRKAGTKKSQFYEWRGMVAGLDREDWLAALAPNYSHEAERSPIDPRAWDFIKSDYLRLEAPKFSACYRRLVEAAAEENWGAIPHERSLRRRLDAEVPKAVQALARKGGEKAKTLYPAQRRSRAHLCALQMVNMDGHKIDVFVRVPWSKEPVRLFLVAIQDLQSGKIVAWRLSDSENKETVRLVIGDLFDLGIPEHMYLDNGRSFASKWITGGARNRFRFKVRDEDPRGLLVSLGVKPHFTTPYSGQSKPIERAFLDLVESIARHPACAGAYTGNNPLAKPENYGSRAIPLDNFRAHVARQIAAHNAQGGRRGGNCAGRSFDETFEASIADPGTIVRRATRAQRSLWLLASEVIRAQKGSGEIHFQGNRYWSRELNQHAGRKVIIRFDPDALHSNVLVYGLDDALICEAPCIADTGFDDLEAARVHAKRRRDYQKALAAERDAHRRITAAELADILTRGEPSPARPEPVRPKVTRLVMPMPAPPASPSPALSREEAEERFGRAMARIGDPAAILPFPAQESPPCDPKGGMDPASTASGSRLPKRKAYGSATKTNA